MSTSRIIARTARSARQFTSNNIPHSRKILMMTPSSSFSIHSSPQKLLQLELKPQMRQYTSHDSGSKRPHSVRQQHPGFVIVPQGEKWVVERMGKLLKVLDSGIHFLIPLVDVVAYKHSTKELAFTITKQTAITKDNVQINIDGVVYIRVHDPEKASYEIDDPFFALSTLAQTTMRSEIGKISLDTTFAERQNLNIAIVEGLEKVANAWGISIRRYEIKDITVPEQIRLAMDLEAEAERKKRKTILESQGERDAQENIALGRKRATELISEANMIEEMNMSKGEAFAIEQKATAYAHAISQLTDAINREGGERAVAFKVAEKYIESFGNLAKRSNTIIVPANVNDASGMITQAATIFDRVLKSSGSGGIPTLSKGQALDKMIDRLHEVSGDTLETGELIEKLKQAKSEKNN